MKKLLIIFTLTLTAAASFTLVHRVIFGGTEPSKPISEVSRPIPEEAAQQSSSVSQDSLPLPSEVSVPMTVDDEEAHPTKHSSWKGECYGGGGKLWSGVAVNFGVDSTITSQEFTDKATGKRLQLEGSFSCIWEKIEAAN